MVGWGVGETPWFFSASALMPALRDLTLVPKPPGLVKVVGVEVLASLAGEIDADGSVSAGAVLAAAAGEVVGLRLVDAAGAVLAAAGEVDGLAVELVEGLVRFVFARWRSPCCRCW